MRIGIYGGSFDPVHNGHLLLAEICREELELAELLFVPSATSPLKPNGPVASDHDRIEMLQLALNGTQMKIDTCEVDRGGVSYTLDTVSEINDAHPNGELFFLMGADLTTQLDSWHAPEKIFSIATPVVMNRGGCKLDLAKLREFAGESGTKPVMLEMPQIELSSGEIRSRISMNKSIRFRMPRAVEEYIRSKSLYSEVQ